MRVRRSLLLLSLGCTACIGLNFKDQNEVVTPPRYLDELCATGGFELDGDVRRTTGLTHDSCGFELGPAIGALKLYADPDVLGIHEGYAFQVLVTDADGNSLGWQPVERAASESTNQVIAGAQSIPIPSEDGPFVVVATVGETRRIVDARFSGGLPDLACSMSPRKR